jgi:hypothetical protein
VVRAAFLISIILLSGCEERELQVSREPLGVQMMRAAPELRGEKFSTLLNFESASDLAFVTIFPAPARIDGRKSHTGQSSLLLPGNVQRVQINLLAVLGDRAFPADWTLVGGYLWSAKPTTVTVRCGSGAATTSRIPAGRWTPVMTEIDPAQSAGVVEVNINRPAGAGLRIDDVMLIDNHKTLFDGGETGATWSIQRRGLHLICERLGAFNFSLRNGEMSDQGWQPDEIGEMRARFRSGNRTMTIYTDGRAYRDGIYQPVQRQNEDPMYAAQHAAPAEIKMAAEFGRVDRQTRGDSDNDGYNETSGAYQLFAAGPRIEFTIIPQTPALVRPIIEIANLPTGKIIATIEGRLVEKTVRTTQGHVLMELPSRLERPALVNVRVQ